MDGVFCALWLATQIQDSICYAPPGIFLDFAWEFSSYFRKRDVFGAIWCWLSTGFEYTKTLIHLIVSEEWKIFPWPFLGSTNIHNYSPPHCVVPENIHTPPTEGIFPMNPPPLWIFQKRPTNYPPLQKFQFFPTLPGNISISCLKRKIS